MSERRCLRLLVSGGVRGLARVVDVLALLELTPEALYSVSVDDGVSIRLEFTADARRAALCQARLRQLVVVRNLADARNGQIVEY
jgi:hypothetical protein